MSTVALYPSEAWLQQLMHAPLGVPEGAEWPPPRELSPLALIARYGVNLGRGGQPLNWFSNMAPLDRPIRDRLGIAYPTVEHIFQAAKTENAEQRRLIAAAPTGSAARRLGRNVDLRSDWEQIKPAVMRAALQAKWSHEPWRSLLLRSGSRRLVEFNSWNDVFWGWDIVKRRGENHLGLLLMELREQLK